MTAKKESTYSFSGDDEEGRYRCCCWWWWWQWWGERQCVTNQVTATLCTEELFLRNQYIQLSPHITSEVWGWGVDIDGQCNTYRQSWLSFRSQPNLHNAEQGFRSLHEFYTIILCLGKAWKVVFFIFLNTTVHYSIFIWPLFSYNASFTRRCKSLRRHQYTPYLPPTTPVDN